MIDPRDGVRSHHPLSEKFVRLPATHRGRGLRLKLDKKVIGFRRSQRSEDYYLCRCTRTSAVPARDRPAGARSLILTRRHE